MTHLDHDQLSAHVDGEPLPDDDAAHLAMCDACREELAALRAVAEAVGAPVPPPPPEAKEAAVAAAVATLRESRERTAVPAGGGAGGRVVPLRRRFVSATAPWLAVAAVMVGLVLGVSLLSTADDGDDSGDGATFDAAAGGGSAAPLDGGDLGEYADDGSLSRVVRERLEAIDMEGLAAERSARGEVSDDEAVSESAEDAAAPMAAAGGDQGPAPQLAARCEPPLRDADPRLANLVYVATLRWKETPAVLLAFALGDPEGTDGRFTTSVYVVAEADCSVLQSQRF